MSTLLTFTDDKLDEYLGIWNKLIERGQQQRLHITLVTCYKIEQVLQNPWLNPWVYTLTYGEEKRELTYEQALRVKAWLEQIARQP